MPGHQRSDVQETDPHEQDKNIAYEVGVMMVALITYHAMICLMLPVCLITDLPIPSIGLPCAVLAMVLCIKKLMRAFSRTGANGSGENGGTADVVEASHDRASVGSDGDGDHGIAQPPVVAIPTSSSGGGLSAPGSGVVTAADVELGGATHHRRGERRGGGDMSGGVEGKNA